MAKVANGEFAATLLAAAGLDRLGLDNTGSTIGTSEMLPAASQGAVGIDCLKTRTELTPKLDAINHADTFACVMAERAFLEALSGNCHSPVAALALVKNGSVWLSGQILSDDGSESISGEGDDPSVLAQQLLAQASPALKALFTS